MTTSYTEEQYQYNYPDGIEDFYWTKARNKIILHEIKKHEYLLNSSILDVGCGRGIVTKFLHNKGIKCFGIELAPALPIKGAEDLIITGKDAFSMNTEFKNSFQTILLLDVIEHIEDPVQFIKELLKEYTTIKHIIITVPARKEIWSEYDVFFGHYRRYDLKMTASLMEEIGFEIIQNAYAFHILYPPAYLGALHLLKRPVKVKIPNARMKTVHNIMAESLLTEYTLMPKKSVGTSIVCVASRV